MQWEGLQEDEATLGPFGWMVKQFPNFHLEGKVKLQASSIDRNKKKPIHEEGCKDPQTKQKQMVWEVIMREECVSFFI